MFRGEIFAYPMYLQKELASKNIQFFCSDVVCKYWPYLQKVADSCPELQDLLCMRPFLSIMHAKAHSWMCEVIKTDIFLTICTTHYDFLSSAPALCFINYNSKFCVNVLQLKWGGRNQEGAGTTIGEEVEQVNSFLSRAAICSKYMSKAGKIF